MFRVKICGITCVEDALAAAAAGADSIGLNFYCASPRFCPPDEAQAIVEAVGNRVRKVGVFVNAPADEILRAAHTLRLDMVQMHGDETPELLREIRPLSVVRAFRLSNDLSSIHDYLRACHALMCVPRMLLIDAARPGQYGGTGATLDWNWIGKNRVHFGGLPLVLAGGLTPENVAQAIEAARPWAVDAASGVESSPGRKSATRMQEFVAEANRALAAIVRK
jgi:phosphoribosylanthranilate isomerase